MSPERWRQIEEVFQQAADMEPDLRRSYIDQACKGDPELLEEVESLLNSEGISHAAPALEQAAQMVSGIGTLEGQRLGAYQILEPIGEGGMGTVYRAKRADGQFDQEVAIKIIKPGAASSVQSRRFLEERKLLAQLQHPFIARLLDGGDHQGIPYLVMELVDGIRIDDYCRHWNLGIRERLELFLQVCEAVQHAHSSLIVHRDLKPSNILVSKEGVPKLLDFGIATLVATDESQTQTGWMMMTPDYASPEQVMGETITVASDVYSLGIVLYELLTGERPYKLKNYAPAEIQAQVCTTQIPPPSSLVLRETRLRRQLKGDLDNILLMALRREPGRRYGSVAQFAEDVRRHLEGETVIARADTFLYRWSKYLRRNKVSIGLAATLLITIVSGALLTAREGIRAQRRFDEVRSLASSLLNEIDPEAAKLTGSTKLRSLLVEKSLSYLDRLAQEAGGDVELQKELGRAYHRVGDIQGHGRRDNLGKYQEAMESHKKALAIEEPLSLRFPNDPDLKRGRAIGYARMGDLLARRGEAKKGEELILKAYELSDPSDPNTFIDVRMSLNRGYMLQGKFDEAIQIGLEAIRVARDLKDPTRRIVAAAYIADTAKYKGDHVLSRQFLNEGFEGIKLLQKEATLAGDQKLRLAMLHLEKGELLYAPDQPNDLRPCEAVAELESSSRIFEGLMKDGGKSVGLLISATTALHFLSSAQAGCGQKEAVATAQKAKTLYTAAVRRPNPNLDLYIGIAYLSTGNLSEAKKHFQSIVKDEITAVEYLADIAVLEGNNEAALKLFASARNQREPLTKTRNLLRPFECYRQAAAIARAIAAGDQTPGLRKTALDLLAVLPRGRAVASVEKLRRDLR